MSASRLNPATGEYWWRARRYFHERYQDRNPSTADIQDVAEWLRYIDFRRAIEPIEQQRRHLVTRYYALQAMPTVIVREDGTLPEVRLKPLPPEFQEIVNYWDELIAVEARRFGYGEDHAG